jgi:hypothetical protein
VSRDVRVTFRKILTASRPQGIRISSPSFENSSLASCFDVEQLPQSLCGRETFSELGARRLRCVSELSIRSSAVKVRAGTVCFICCAPFWPNAAKFSPIVQCQLLGAILGNTFWPHLSFWSMFLRTYSTGATQPAVLIAGTIALSKRINSCAVLILLIKLGQRRTRHIHGAFYVAGL